MFVTGYNTKRWYVAKSKLLTEQESEQIQKLISELSQIAEEELQNAESTIPLVEADSRLGWEPGMDYLGGKHAIEWKI